MPWSPKQHRFFAMCSTPKGRAKAHGKCPSMSDSKRMMKEGIKRKKRKKKAGPRSSQVRSFLRS